VNVKLFDIRNCVLEWWEKTDQPYVTGMTPNVWCDMYRLAPNSDVFQQWNFQLRCVPLGQSDFVINDPPGIMTDETESRTLLFEIRVKENNPGGYAPNMQRRIRAKQVLRSNPEFHEFVVLQNDFSGNAELGPPSW
jgi:hypothetical protein